MMRVPGAGLYDKVELRRLLPALVDLSPCGRYYMLADRDAAHHVGCPDGHTQEKIHRMIAQGEYGWEGLRLPQNPTERPGALADYLHTLRVAVDGREYHPLCAEWAAVLPEWLAPRRGGGQGPPPTFHTQSPSSAAATAASQARLSYP